MLDDIARARRRFMKTLMGGAAVVAGREAFGPLGRLVWSQELPGDVGPRASIATEVRVEKKMYRPGEVVRGQATLNSPRTDLPVEMVWTDSYGRVAGRVRALSAHPFNNVAEFALPLDNPLTYVNRVEALVDGVTQ